MPMKGKIGISFFWCRDLTPPLSGRDYSYITLDENGHQAHRGRTRHLLIS